MNQHPEIALAAAAIAAYDDDLAVERARFFITAARGRPEVADRVARTVELDLLGHPCTVGVYRLAPERYRLEIAGRWTDVGVERLGPGERRLKLGERDYATRVVPEGPGYRVEVDGEACQVGLDQAGIVRAPSPAVVVGVAVGVGDRVEIGDRLVVLEAMKMEMSVTARFAGKVREVFVVKHVQVGTGQALLVIEPDTAAAASGEPPAAPLDLAALPQVVLEEDPKRLCRQAIDELGALLLGYDVGRGHLRWLMDAQRKLCRQLACDDESLCRGEERLLALFADVSALFEREPEPADLEEGTLWPAATFRSYLRDLDAESERLPRLFIDKLRRALAHYGVVRLERGPELEEALFRLYRSHHRIEEQVAPILAILERRLEAGSVLAAHAGEGLRAVLDRLIAETRGRFAAVRDGARELRYRSFDHAPWSTERERIYTATAADLERLEQSLEPAERAAIVQRIVDCPLPVRTLVSGCFETAGPAARAAMLEALLRRHYRIRQLGELELFEDGGRAVAIGRYPYDGKQICLYATQASYGELDAALAALLPRLGRCPADDDVAIDVFLWRPSALDDAEATAAQIAAKLGAVGFPRPIRRIVIALSAPGAGPGAGDVQTFTFRQGETGGFNEEKLYRGLHPLVGKRLHLWRFANFTIERLWPSEEDVYLFRGVANANARDVRLFALAEVRSATPVRDAAGRVVELPQLERVYQAALAGIRRFQVRRGPRERLYWNRVLLYVWPVLELKSDELHALARRLLAEAEGLGLEKVVIHAQLGDGRESKESVLHLQSPEGGEPVVRIYPPGGPPIASLDAYEQRVVRLRQRGLLDPYELIAMLAPERRGAASRFPPGEFEEYDLDTENRLVKVERPRGGNRANIVIGVVRNFTAEVPEGMTRVVLLGDPGNAMGSLAEPECRRILAGLDLAEQLGVPLEWFAVSAGAKIAMDSGTENMDWIAAVLRRLIEFTQAGGEVNVVVLGINVGAQPYWNAEATMLMHTRGILIMTAEGAMVLTGKQALDYSGGVSAEDNFGIGGYEHVMGPNGQAQYFAKDVGEACEILLRHYEHTYVVPGERFPRRAATSDPLDRDVCSFPHGRRDGTSFATVGEIFSEEKNPGRKKPFDIRRVMAAVADQDHAPLERWERMRDAEIGVVWDAHVGGWPVLLLGIESRPLPRLGTIPADGPDRWTAGTLFPMSSKKIARALNGASGNRPAVILANLSGFDGSPDSMRSLQLEYGAEIGRAVVNFRGPIVFCVVSRYHGGAFVVFSGALNPAMEIAALEGTHASVIGGAPAAAVVFAREVEKRAHADTRVEALERQLAAAEGAEKVRLQTQLREIYAAVHSEKLGEVAEEFDAIHSIYRAQKVGSVHHILPPERLRPYLVEAIERGMGKAAPLGAPSSSSALA